jgi:anti-sigma factor RsiW
MRTMRTTARRCDRAREYASLRLDGELSEFESALLDSHLERCPSCRAFAHDLVAVTGRLREAPLEPVRIPVSLPRRQFGGLRSVQLGAAAAAIMSVVGIGSLFGLLSSSANVTNSPPAVSNVQERAEFQELRRAVLTAPHPERRPGGLGNLEV